jgi:hypothetical protein
MQKESSCCRRLFPGTFTLIKEEKFLGDIGTFSFYPVKPGCHEAVLWKTNDLKTYITRCLFVWHGSLKNTSRFRDITIY